MVVEFFTEKHAHTFNKLQKLCIILTDQVATDSVKLSKFFRKAKIYNASSFFLKKKKLKILRFVYTVLCSFYVSSFVKFKVSFFIKKRYVSNTHFKYKFSKFIKFTRMGRSKDFEDAQFQKSSCLTQNKVVDEHKTASVTGYIWGITVFKIFIWEVYRRIYTVGNLVLRRCTSGEVKRDPTIYLPK